VAAVGMETSAFATIAAPEGVRGTAGWITELEQKNVLGQRLSHPVPATYLAPVSAGLAVTGAVAVFDTIGSGFPPALRSVLDRFMHQVRQSAENIAMHESIKALAIRDGLTGLYNHRYFQDRIQEEFARAKRYHHPL